MNNKFTDLPIFEGLNESEIREIISNGFIKLYKKGDIILSENKMNYEFHTILSGVVKVIKGEKEKEKSLGFLQRGDFYGEMSLILNKPHSASIITKEDTEILVFLDDEFNTFFLGNVTIMRNLLKKMSERLALMDVEVINLAYFTIKNRLMTFIRYITENGTKEARITLTHQELAQIIGTNRETITRIINDLKEKDLLKINKDKKILILNKENWEL